MSENKKLKMRDMTPEQEVRVRELMRMGPDEPFDDHHIKTLNMLSQEWFNKYAAPAEEADEKSPVMVRKKKSHVEESEKSDHQNYDDNRAVIKEVGKLAKGKTIKGPDISYQGGAQVNMNSDAVSEKVSDQEEKTRKSKYGGSLTLR